MKNSALMVLLLSAILCAFSLFATEAPPLFSPEPPEPGAALLVNAYLPFLAAGDFPQALALNDLRGMRQYLLERRIGELKAKNPELSDVDIEKMSAQIQVNDLAPARLQEILLQIMKESNFTGMKWNIRGYAPAPESVRPPSNGSARRLRPRRHHEIQRHLVIKIIIQLYFKTTNTQRRSGILIKNTIEAPP